MSDDQQPLFDSSRKALDFALNQVVPKMPRPFMSKAMAEHQVKPEKRRLRKGQIVEEASEALLLLESEEAKLKVKRSAGIRPPPLSELEGAATAGFILRHAERLDLRHHTILMGVMIKAYQPCVCKAPCCSGRRADSRWIEAVKQTCLLLHDAGDIMVNPAKRGLSTKPELRLSLVQQYYTKAFEHITWMAGQHSLSATTVALHKTLIDAWLNRLEAEAWQELDAIFDQAGVTGSLEPPK